MSTDAPLSRARAGYAPHPATISRAKAAQPKLAPELPPHPAKMPRVKAVQPKLAKEHEPHPATLPRVRAVQPKLAEARAPHPATLSPSSPVRRFGDAAPHAATVAK